MAADPAVLDLLESKVKEIELKVYGEKLEPTENFNPIIDSFLQSNAIIATAISGHQKFESLMKGLLELHKYLDLTSLNEDTAGINTKLNVILSVKEEFQEVAEQLENLNKLKHVLDDDKIKNTQLLKNDLNNLLSKHLEKKEKLNQINSEANELLLKFNEICLEITKCFFMLNEAITKLENAEQ